MLEAATLAQIIIDWNQASHGCKTSVLEAWAKVLKMSTNTLWRDIRKSRRSKRKKRSDTGSYNPEYAAWTKIIWQLKLRPPEEAGMVITEHARRAALKDGIIPPRAAAVPLGTFSRIARELKLNRGQGERWVRFQAKYPNLLHQFDASSSKFFYIHHRMPDGERVLRLHRPAKHYKNKPVPIRERPWVYGVVDDHSGYCLSRYVAAEGESAAHGVDFLAYAWGCEKDSRLTMRGLPKLLMLDNGPLAKSTPMSEFFERLGVKKVLGKPYAKKGHGKIERPWRTLWKNFELSFFMMSDWEKFEITLTEFNRQLDNYLVEYAQRPHRYEHNISREQSWMKVIERGGVVDIPPEALLTIFRREERTAKGGYFTFANQEYEIDGMTEGKIWVYKGVFDVRLIVESQETHQKYEAKISKPLSFGERIEVIQTEAEKLLEQGGDLLITHSIYEEATETNLVAIPVRGEEREIEDPLAVPAPAQKQEALLFGTPRERYEWLLQKECAGDVLPADEIEFMREFETTDTFSQNAASYQRLQAFWSMRRAAG